MRERKSVADLIHDLGGTFAVARLMRVVPTAVSNAKADEHLPESWKYRLFKVLKARKLKGFDHLLDEEPIRRTRPSNDDEQPNSSAA